MNITDRCNKTIDFILSLHDNGEFSSLIRDGKSQTKYTPVEWKLALTSVLLTAGKIFCRDDAAATANIILQKLESYRFSNQTLSCLIVDDKSFNPWNAWMSIIHLKLGNITDAEMYMSSLLQSIHNEYIPAYFSKVTPDEIFNENYKMQSPYGIIILSLLFAYLYTDKGSYLLSAKEVGHSAINKSRFDPHDVWGMRLLYDRFKDPIFKSHAEYVLSQTDAVSILSMASLVASMVQQSNLAWIKYIPDRIRRCEEILEYQISLQSDIGGFFRSRNNNEMRLDYAYQNLLSFIQYQQILQDMSEKEILGLIV
jgi:hypothetical protein